MYHNSESKDEVCNKTFSCPSCPCFFFTESDLAVHLNTFSDTGEAHKDAFRRLHSLLRNMALFG